MFFRIIFLVNFLPLGHGGILTITFAPDESGGIPPPMVHMCACMCELGKEDLNPQ